MENIASADISITRHRVDGFTLSYIADNNRYYKDRYIGYGVREAKRRFKEYVYSEMLKEEYPLNSADDVVLQALRCICRGSIAQARELMGSA